MIVQVREGEVPVSRRQSRRMCVAVRTASSKAAGARAVFVSTFSPRERLRAEFLQYFAAVDLLLFCCCSAVVLLLLYVRPQRTCQHL